MGIELQNGARVDQSTSVPICIDYAHHEIHGGSHYTCSSRQLISDTETYEVLITVPNTTKWAHMRYFFGGTLDTDIEVYEAATHTAGAALTCVNNNRNSANTAGIAVNVSNDDGADGTLIFITGFGSDTGGGATRRVAGGDTRGDSEFILKQNTKYLVRITSNSDVNKITLLLEWYEHTNK